MHFNASDSKQSLLFQDVATQSEINVSNQAEDLAKVNGSGGGVVKETKKPTTENSPPPPSRNAALDPPRGKVAFMGKKKILLILASG